MDRVGSALQMIGWVSLPVLILPLLVLLFAQSKFIISLTRGLIEIIDLSVFKLGELVKWLLPVLVLSVAGSVFALSIFGVTTTALQESARYFQAIIITLGAAATLLAGQHVRVDIFHARLRDIGKARVDLWAFYLLLLPVCLLIVWNSQSFVGFSWSMREGSSEADGIRGVFLLKTLIPVFAISMIVQGFAISLRAALCLIGLDRPARPAGVPPFFRTSGQDIL